MLKIKLTKDEHAGLPAHFQSEYKAEGDSFVLDTDQKFEDVKPLKNALEQEKKHRKEATERVTTLEGEVSTLTARAGAAGDIEKSWQAKLDKAVQDAKAKQDGMTNQLRGLLVDNVAIALAGEISTAPDLILPHIKGRLAIEEVDGKYITRVLDSEGKASASSVNELKSEIVADKRFAPIITASKASGGGASGGNKGMPPGGKAFKDMNEAERVTLFKTDRAAFDRLSAESTAAK